MVSQNDYEKKTTNYWKTVTVRTKRVLRNGCLEIPTGTICKITNKQGGFTLQTDPCKYCGVRVYITKVPPEAVEIVSTG